MARLLDITAPLSSQMPVWPGNPAVSIEQAADMSKGHLSNTKQLRLPNHTGTHMDAPRHFIAEGKTLDDLPLEVVCGKARVIYLDTDAAITAEQLQKAGIEGEQRLLIRTRNSEKKWWTQPFLHHFAHLSTEAAQWLATTSVALVGVDYLSVSGYQHNELEVHHALLGRDIWIIEGLMLRDIAPGHYNLYCLPLKLQEGDGAPCRAILEEL